MELRTCSAVLVQMKGFGSSFHALIHLRMSASSALDGTMVAAPDQLVGDAGEPPFDLVDPAGIGWREMHIETRMRGKPFTDRRGLMGAAIVADQVEVQVDRNLRIDLDQELAKFDGAMPAVQTRDHGAVRSVERGEQAGGAVPKVIMWVRFSGIPGIIGNAGWDRARAWTCDFSQRRAQPLPPAGRGTTKVQPDDVVNLLHEHWIVGQLEPVSPVRFELERVPDPSNCRSRKTRFLSHGSTGPMSRVLRGGFQGVRHDPFHLRRRDRWHPTRTRIIIQAVQTELQERLRHLPTVGCETPSRAATSLFGRPSTHPRTIRDRSAKAWAEDRRRAHRCNCSRSSEVNSSNAFWSTRSCHTPPLPVI